MIAAIQAVSTNLSRFVRRAAVWLFVEPRKGWALPLVPIGVWAAMYMLAPTWEQRVRLSGMLLQLAGLAVVAFGLHKTRRAFKLPTVSEWTRQWWKDRPRWTIPPATLEAHSALHGRSATHVDLRGQAASLGAGFEERIKILEGRADMLEEWVGQERDARKAEARERLRAMDTERSERAGADAELKRLMSEAVASGIRLEMLGVVWLVVGVILASAPCEVAGLFGASCRAGAWSFRMF
jgi:hypothetical protein